MKLKSKFVTGLLVVGLVGSGGTAVIAASGGNGKGQGPDRSQYCPPNSPGAGKPKDPGPGGNKCGHPLQFVFDALPAKK